MSSLHNDYLEQQYENAQEEAHQHFVIEEFSSLLLSEGPNSILGQMNPDAKEELILACRGK